MQILLKRGELWEWEGRASKDGQFSHVLYKKLHKKGCQGMLSFVGKKDFGPLHFCLPALIAFCGKYNC